MGTALSLPVFEPFVTEPLANGEAIMGRQMGVSSNQLTSGDVLFSYFTAQKTESVGFITTCTGSNTTPTAATYSAVGLYSVDGSGNLSQIAVSANSHLTMWIAQFTEYKTSMITPVTKFAGQLYAVGVLCVSGTQPSLVCANSGAFYFTRSPVMMSGITGQSTLPTSVATGSLASGPPFGAIVQAVISPS